jgi:hypothetical protein
MAFDLLITLNFSVFAVILNGLALFKITLDESLRVDITIGKNERVKIKPLLTQADLITRCEKEKKCLQKY